jgi:hypothetical protein
LLIQSIQHDNNQLNDWIGVSFFFSLSLSFFIHICIVHFVIVDYKRRSEFIGDRSQIQFQSVDKHFQHVSVDISTVTATATTLHLCLCHFERNKRRIFFPIAIYHNNDSFIRLIIILYFSFLWSLVVFSSLFLSLSLGQVLCDYSSYIG